jgi:hypothetical protein
MASEVRIVVRATDATDATLNNINRKVRTSFRAKMKTAFYGVGLSSGLSFTSGLLNGISFGRLGGGIVARLRPQAALWGAKAGTGMGAALGAALLIQASNVLAAGLPLILGAGLMAGPVAWLAGGEGRAKSKLTAAQKRKKTLLTTIANPHSTEKAVASAKWMIKNRVDPEIAELTAQSTRVSKLKTQVVDFMDTISKPLQTPFTKMLQEIGKGMERLEGPMIRMVKGIGPALVPFTKGVMGLLTEFVKALEPRMPSIAAGMKAWGEAAPKIGKGMGEFLGKLMKDPEGTVQALEDLGKAVSDIASAAATMVTQLGDAAAAYGRFAEKIDKYENRLDDNGGPLKAMWKDLVFYKGKFETTFDQFRGWVEPKFRSLGRMMATRARDAVENVRDWFAKLPGWLSRSSAEAGSRLKQRWNEARSAVSERARGIYNAVTGRLRTLPGWVSRNADQAGDRLRQRWTEAKNGVTTRVRMLSNNVTNILRSLPGRISRALSGAKSAVMNRFAGAGTWLRSKGAQIINGLFQGLRAPWQKVKNWVSGIAKWIKEHKGPIDLDRRLLVPAGKALMGGLLSGLKFGFGPVGDFVYKAGSKISDVIGGIGSSANGRGGLGPRAAAARDYVMRMFGITNIGGYANRNIAGTNQKSMHAFGKAIDIMTYNGGAIAKFFAGAGRALFGVNNVIWQRKINSGGSWRPYGGIPHMNHVHVDFFGKGGVIREPVHGIGQRTGRGYVIGENGPETITPGVHTGRGGGAGGDTVVEVHIGDHYLGRFVAGLIKEHDRSTRRLVTAGNNGGF